eukprot:8680327-Pyramimonas_sp.AAC.1
MPLFGDSREVPWYLARGEGRGSPARYRSSRTRVLGSGGAHAATGEDRVHAPQASGACDPGH